MGVDIYHNAPYSCFWVSIWVGIYPPKGVKIPLYTVCDATQMGSKLE